MAPRADQKVRPLAWPGPGVSQGGGMFQDELSSGTFEPRNSALSVDAPRGRGAGITVPLPSPAVLQVWPRRCVEWEGGRCNSSSCEVTTMAKGWLLMRSQERHELPDVILEDEVIGWPLTLSSTRDQRPPGGRAASTALAQLSANLTQRACRWGALDRLSERQAFAD